MRIPSGSTDRVLYFVALDATDLITRETALATWTVYRSRNGGAATVYTTPTIAELSAADMPGVYALTLDEDTTLAAGHDEEEAIVHITHAGMAPVTRSIEIYRTKFTEGQSATMGSSAVAATIAAGAIATDAVDANALKADAVTEIQAGLATAASQSSITTSIAAIQLDTDDIQNRLPAVLVGGRMNASVQNMAVDVLDANALKADAVTEIQAGLATAAALATVGADVLTRSTPAQVNAEVLDVLTVDTFTEPGQGTPPATLSILDRLRYLFKNWRNRKTQTSGVFKLFGDDAATVDQKSTYSDDGTTGDRGEMASGP